eukprot:8289-Heterococcus_DN1.PRE.4
MLGSAPVCNSACTTAVPRSAAAAQCIGVACAWFTAFRSRSPRASRYRSTGSCFGLLMRCRRVLPSRSLYCASALCSSSSSLTTGR